MGSLLKPFFFKNLRELNALIYRFYLYPDKFVFNFDKEVNIVKSVPLVRSRFYFKSKLFLKLSINCFNFSPVTIKSAVNNELKYVIYTISFCYFFYFRLNDFCDFYIKLFTEAFYMLFRFDIFK